MAVNAAGNYTKPSMRKSLFNRIKAGGKGGRPSQWSARKAQMLARMYKAKGGGYQIKLLKDLYLTGVNRSGELLMVLHQKVRKDIYQMLLGDR